MREETFVDRMRSVYLNERDYKVRDAEGEPLDPRDLRHSASLRIFNEIATWDTATRDTQILAVIEHAMLKIGQSADKSASPRFTDGGHCQLRTTDILRVGENAIIGVVFATEDDWLAYLKIKRTNYDRQERNWRQTEQGVVARVAGLRDYGRRTGVDRPRTLDAEPYLFESEREERAA